MALDRAVGLRIESQAERKNTVQSKLPATGLSPFRRFIKRFHPEAIPWPGSVFYNKLSQTSIFQANYKVLAKDITGYCDVGRILDIGTGPGWLLIHLHHWKYPVAALNEIYRVLKPGQYALMYDIASDTPIARNNFLRSPRRRSFSMVQQNSSERCTALSSRNGWLPDQEPT